MPNLIRSLSVVLALTLASCGEAERESSKDVDGSAAGRAGDVVEQAGGGSAGRTEGGYISFSVDGQEKRFTHMPADKNMAMSAATMLLARPDQGGREQLSILVTNFNVKSEELPVTLSLGLREAMESEEPATFLRAPKPMISYVSPTGIKYTSYADMTFESYADGIATGSISAIELSPEKRSSSEAAPIELSNLRFRVPL